MRSKADRSGATASGASLTSLFSRSTTGSSSRASTSLNEASPRFGSRTTPTLGQSLGQVVERAVGRAVVDDRHRAGDRRPRRRLDDRGQALGQQLATVVIEDQDVRSVGTHGVHPSCQRSRVPPGPASCDVVAYDTPLRLPGQPRPLSGDWGTAPLPGDQAGQPLTEDRHGAWLGGRRLRRAGDGSESRPDLPGGRQAAGVYVEPRSDSSRRLVALMPSGSVRRLPSYSMPT